MLLLEIGETINNHENYSVSVCSCFSKRSSTGLGPLTGFEEPGG